MASLVREIRVLTVVKPIGALAPLVVLQREVPSNRCPLLAFRQRCDQTSQYDSRCRPSRSQHVYTPGRHHEVHTKSAAGAATMSSGQRNREAHRTRFLKV